MKFECATVEEAQAKVEALASENKYVICALQNTDGYVVEWQEHKKYIAQDGQEFPDEVWVTKEGKLIQVQDLEIEHMRNVLRMLLRQDRESRAVMAQLGEKMQATLDALQESLDTMSDDTVDTPRMLH